MQTDPKRRFTTTGIPPQWPLGTQLHCDKLIGTLINCYLIRLHLGQIDEVPENDWQSVEAGKLTDTPFNNAISDFYLTNPIARASQLMAELSANAKARKQGAMAAE